MTQNRRTFIMAVVGDGAMTDMGPVPLLHGAEPVEPADREGTRPYASDVQAMTSQLREGLTAEAPQPELAGTIEADELYVVQDTRAILTPSKKTAGRGRRRRLKGARGRGTLE